MNTTIRVFKETTFALILTSTVFANNIPFIISKSKRSKNIKITKTFNKVDFPRSRMSTIAVRSKNSNSFKNLMIHPICRSITIRSITSKFKFAYSMLANITVFNNMTHNSFVNKRSLIKFFYDNVYFSSFNH